MLKIAITPEIPSVMHSERVNLLLEAGWDYVHIRYPGCEESIWREVISGINPELRQRVTLHEHPGLAEELGCGGLHLGRRMESVPENWTGRVSRSCHSISELDNADTSMTYVTLSPVYPSISKQGYGTEDRMLINGFRNKKLSGLKVIALGGVTFDRLHEISDAGFSGFAAIGCVGWENNIEKFKQNIKLCCNL